ncbi:unnamed protein product, partial [Didymodactylos carnosus]
PEQSAIEITNESNLTLNYIQKFDYGLYTCQASNEYTRANATTLIIVEHTTPQAPLNFHANSSSSSSIELSWEPGYDGGLPQHFIVWYRKISTGINKKLDEWKQIRVLPNNISHFTIFDLNINNDYNVAVVGENKYGLGTFSSILNVKMNSGNSVGYLYHNSSDKAPIYRPRPPNNIRLEVVGRNLLVSWNHPLFSAFPKIIYYVVQIRSLILIDNQQQETVVINYPQHTYLFKNIKHDASYVVQVLAYSEHAYSPLIESKITIEFNRLSFYSSSNRLLLSLLCILIILTMTSLCTCLFCLLRYYLRKKSYFTNIPCESESVCSCLPRFRYRLQKHAFENDRYHASLLKSSDLISSSPIATKGYHHTNGHITASDYHSQQPFSKEDFSPASSLTTNGISLAKILTIPRCRDVSQSNSTPELTRGFISNDNPRIVVSPELTLTKNEIKPTNLSSFFQPITTTTTNNRPLEVVPEDDDGQQSTSLTLARNQFNPLYSTTTTARSIQQPSPKLITFDSNSLKRRSLQE